MSELSVRIEHSIQAVPQTAWTTTTITATERKNTLARAASSACIKTSTLRTDRAPGANDARCGASSTLVASVTRPSPRQRTPQSAS